MTAVTLYRAADAEAPHFGRGSYWTRSESFARRFKLWLDQNYEGDHAIYRAGIDLAGELEVPFGLFLDSAKVSRQVEQLAGATYTWLSFYEKGAFEGVMTRQYVYLGDEPIRAEAAEWQPPEDQHPDGDKVAGDGT